MKKIWTVRKVAPTDYNPWPECDWIAYYRTGKRTSKEFKCHFTHKGIVYLKQKNFLNRLI